MKLNNAIIAYFYHFSFIDWRISKAIAFEPSGKLHRDYTAKNHGLNADFPYSLAALRFPEG
jgi:hypothetical protein